MNAISVLTKIKDLQRLRQILAVLAKYGYGHMIERLGLEGSKVLGTIIPSPTAPKGTNPERIRSAFEELGPTFIKLGQILSTRPDLVPPDYVAEFSKLQDDVSPFPIEEVEDQIRLELGTEIPDAFSRFDPTPVASASLSQVHKAVLKNGRQVAVKVQRPGIKPLIESDIDLMYLLARLATKTIPELNLYSPIKIIREFERTMMKELDFTIEAANSERFRKNFKNNEEINFPAVHSDLSGKRIITMDFINGVKITDAKVLGIDQKTLARLGLRAVMEMVFRDGFFHSDPHPGNVFVMPHPLITYLDLGQVGRVSEDIKNRMLLLLLAITREDFEEVVQILYRIGIKEEDVDTGEFRSDVLDICEKHFGKQLKYIELGAFLKDIFEGAFRHKIRIPYEYALMCKALVTMESVGKTLDPEINIFEESKPYLLEIFKNRYSFENISKDLTKALAYLSTTLQEAPPQIKNILDRLEEGKFKIRVDDAGAVKRALMWEAAINRIILVVLIALLVFSSLMLLIFKSSSALAVFFAVGGFALASFLGLWVILSILRSGS
ncbi:MAG: AarF/ABC1/UbiB kinase family protein [Candidatus Dadabacteria bacterium]|nr:AarF/ABC1/UbiB kinase family protein [Candidatus Dadabacteria bacterium]